MAIEAQQFTQKDELIAKFYTLRAGLSAIAEENLSITPLEAKINEYKYRLSKDEALIKNKYDDFEKNQKPILEKEINKRKHIIQWELSKFKKDLDCCQESITSREDNLTELNKPNAYLYYKTSIFTSKKTAIKELQNKIQTITEEIEYYKEKIPFIKSQIEQLENKLENKETITNPWSNISDENNYKEKINNLEEQLESLIPLCTKKVKSIKDALDQQFRNTLTEADWENVDLLIFYLYTGRADSLKEALLLVDRQKQTDQICDAIESASEYISNTINTNTYRLASVMTRCCEQLSNQINANHRETIAAIHTNTESVDKLSVNFGMLEKNLDFLGTKIERQNETLINAERLNTSLLAQANRSSEELMYELRYNQRYWVK